MSVQPVSSSESFDSAATSFAVSGPPTVTVDTARVLHVINGEHFSGAERVQDLLAKQLPTQGFEVEFVCVKPGRFPEVRTSQTSLHCYGMRHRLDLRPAWRVADLVRREGFQLIHAHTPRSALVGNLAARLAKVPLVYHVHSPVSRDSTRRFSNWLNAWNERLSVRQAAALIAVSGSLGRFMREMGYDSSQVHVVPNGVPAAELLRNETPPTTEWVLGSVALFRPRKGLEILLEALALLRCSGHHVRLRAVGPFETPDYESSIRQLASDLELDDAIDWIGFTNDVSTELTKMDLFVLPSLFGEGLPMVVLEAMAAGVPVLGTRVEGVPEAVEHGQTGLLAQPGAATDLAKQISELVSGNYDWQKLRENALKTHADRFSDQAMAAGVANVYRSVLRGK